jgi:hypothetical protein
LATAARRAIALSPLFLLVTSACTDFEGLRLAGNSCELAHPPDPPGATADAGDGDTTFTVAAWHLQVVPASDGGAPASTGYDLDGTCTTAGAATSCKEPSWATASHADGPGGRDNALAGGAQQFQGILSTTGGAASASLIQVIQVTGYNGLPADDRVTVTYYGALLHEVADGGAATARWDGTDAYDVVDGWLEGPSIDQPRFRDTHAYVTPIPAGDGGARAGVLVSKVDSLLVGNGPFLALGQALVTAQVVRAPTGWTLANATVAGRVRADDLLHILTGGRDPLTGSAYCRGAGAYPLARQFICSLVDIHVAPPDDGTQPCDAISWAWTFDDSVPVSLAGVVPAPPGPTDGCAADQSPAVDTCGP